ncbi:unknown [Clostridium sp. CAG:433]|nr:unknown [Clostridium sp. CAG:433]
MKDRIMKLDKNIQEYIGLGLRAGLFNKNNLERIVSRLERVNFSVDNNNPGDAQTESIRDRNNPRISYGLNVKMNERRTLNSGRYYFKDEVLFHELTHCINGIYENFMENLSLWFDLDKMFENNFSVKSDAIESMANDPNYRQKSYSWLVLDEFVAQYVAQLLVETKYNKKIYVNESKLIRQSNPSINVNNNFADYHEFYDIVINFIKPIYGNDLNKFIADSLDSTVINKIFSYYKNEPSGFVKLYSLLGEMGNIGFAVASPNFTEVQRATDYDMIARDSHNFYLHYNEVLKIINIILDRKSYIPGIEGNFGGLKQ